MATSILPQVDALPTKDVRRNKETHDFDAYLIYPDGNEVYCGSRARSWDAETLCDEEYYKVLKARPAVVEPVYRSYIDSDGTPMESIRYQETALVRVVGDPIALLLVAGHSIEVDSEALAQLASLLGAI